MEDGMREWRGVEADFWSVGDFCELRRRSLLAVLALLDAADAGLSLVGEVGERVERGGGLC